MAEATHHDETRKDGGTKSIPRRQDGNFNDIAKMYDSNERHQKLNQQVVELIRNSGILLPNKRNSNHKDDEDDNTHDTLATSSSSSSSLMVTLFEFGCGTGSLCLSLGHHPQDPPIAVYGVDISEKMLEIAHAKIEQQNPSTWRGPAPNLIQLDLKDTHQLIEHGFPTQFNVLLVGMVLHHVPDPVSKLKLFYDMIEPMGHLIIVEFGVRTTTTASTGSSSTPEGHNHHHHHHHHQYNAQDHEQGDAPAKNSVMTTTTMTCERNNPTPHCSRGGGSGDHSGGEDHNHHPDVPTQHHPHRQQDHHPPKHHDHDHDRQQQHRRQQHSHGHHEHEEGQRHRTTPSSGNKRPHQQEETNSSFRAHSQSHDGPSQGQSHWHSHQGHGRSHGQALLVDSSHQHNHTHTNNSNTTESDAVVVVTREERKQQYGIFADGFNPTTLTTALEELGFHVEINHDLKLEDDTTPDHPFYGFPIIVVFAQKKQK
jgi:2-polyprenyl-3-methyl-5-hydroxy-6-metoxy-1,4-benzoquinol methylase